MVCLNAQQPNEVSKVAQIVQEFDRVLKSSESVIILDDIERLIEYVPIGPRFSNMILQTLFLLLKRIPPPGHKLLVIATTSNAQLLDEMELDTVFSTFVHIPRLNLEEVQTVLNSLQLDVNLQTFEQNHPLLFEKDENGIPIKQLLHVIEMTKTFHECE